MVAKKWACRLSGNGGDAIPAIGVIASVPEPGARLCIRAVIHASSVPMHLLAPAGGPNDQPALEADRPGMAFLA